MGSKGAAYGAGHNGVSMEGVTAYTGLSRFYFQHLLRRIIVVGELRRPGIGILDFGCGKGELKRLLPGAKVIGYDIHPSLSDVRDWRKVRFDVLVANEVFYTFREAQLERFLKELRRKNPRLELVVGISRMGWLNQLGKYLLGRPNAHSAVKLRPRREAAILEDRCRILRQEGVFGLADVYRLKFK